MLAVVVVLVGCGLAVRLGYNQAPSLAFRWLDGYVDFDDAQSLRVRTALDDWFAWHRRTQLPDYADLLARLRTDVQAPATADQVCGWAQEIRHRIEVGLERAAPAMADVMPTLSLRQIAAIEKKYADRNAEYRDDFLQRDPVKRRRAAVERQVEQAERLYGRLDKAQRELVARAVAQSPMDADLAYAERLQRQADLLAVLRKLTAARASPAMADAEIRAYVQRLERSPRDDYRRVVERLTAYNCAFVADLHNSTSPAQRAEAAKRLKGYEDDLRALAAEGA